MVHGSPKALGAGHAGVPGLLHIGRLRPWGWRVPTCGNYTSDAERGQREREHG